MKLDDSGLLFAIKSGGLTYMTTVGTKPTG